MEVLSTPAPTTNSPTAPVCTENLIHVDEMRESPKLTRWLRFYALCLRSWPRRNESDELRRREFENLAGQYLRLAEETNRNASANPPTRKVRPQS
jgi:hypothetical protein